MKKCKYVCDSYNVPADIGRKVIIDGKNGIIAEDRGNYIGVNFDEDNADIVYNCHPTWKVEYGEIGKIRKLTRSQQRYQRYHEFGDCFDSFIDFCLWDAEPERSWNSGSA